MTMSTVTRGLLVAETDEKGRVVHVWIKEAEDRYAHPFRPTGVASFAALDRYRITGARHEDVTGWLSSQH